MTTPIPGVAHATVTNEHTERALLALLPAGRYGPSDVADLALATPNQVRRVAQALANVAQALADTEARTEKRVRAQLEQAIADDPNPALTGPALDGWNAATIRAVNVTRNFPLKDKP